MSAATEEPVLQSHFAAILHENTRLRSPALCPEIPLHLLRPDAPVWNVREQDTSQPFPYWGVAWGSGQALARWILDHPQVVSGRRVADLGCGSGIAAIAAAMSGAASVLAVDRCADAMRVTERNAAENRVSVHTVQAGLFDLNVAALDVLLLADLGYLQIDLISQLQQYASPRQIVLLAEPGRRGAILYEVELLETYAVRAEPEIEAFFVQQASVFQLRPFVSRGPGDGKSVPEIDAGAAPAR